MCDRVPSLLGQRGSDGSARDLEAIVSASGKIQPKRLVNITAETPGRVVDLAVNVAEGAVWANASRSHMAASLAGIPAEKRNGDFFIGNMIPTCIDDDREAAAAVNRRTLTGYVILPNYRNYWKEAGYVEEMEAIEKALANKERDKLQGLMSDRWLADATLYGSVKEVREGVEAWFAAGVKTPIIVPSSTKGGQMKAFEEVMDAFA